MEKMVILFMKERKKKRKKGNGLGIASLLAC